MKVTRVLEVGLRAVEIAVEVRNPGDEEKEYAWFNLDRFLAFLREEEVQIETVNRGGLLAELEAVRDERSVQRAKLEKFSREGFQKGAGQFQQGMIDALDRRETELLVTLWPPRR